MAALENVDRISFVVDTLVVKDGKKLGTIRPDSDGYYTVPLAVLGIPTDNHTYYDVSEFTQQLTSPTSILNRKLTDGKLYGEWGHPKINLLDEKQVIPRLLDIDEDKMCHHFKKIWTGEKLASGGIVIYGAIKPTGPRGEHLKANLDDPCMNTSFSLRSIASSRQEGNIMRRKVKQLVTFDYVTAGGYNQASKRFSPSNESIDISLTDKNFKITEAALECFNNTELNEIFGAKQVMIGRKTMTYIGNTGTLKDESGNSTSVFKQLITMKK